jgi:zinc protease
MVCWKTPAATLSGPESAAQTVLAEYLAGPISPLHKKLVLEKQLVESIEPDAEVRRDPGLFCIEAVLKQEQFRADVNTEILAAVNALGNGTVDASRLKAIQDHLKYGAILHLETPQAIAGTVARTSGIFGPPDALEQLYKKIAALKATDLSAFGKAYLNDQNRTTLTFEGPDKPAGGAQ